VCLDVLWACRDFTHAVITAHPDHWIKTSYHRLVMMLSSMPRPLGPTCAPLLSARRQQVVERPPVWMMRQAGRHMKVYRDLVSKYPTFRERSEIPEVSTEISLQPWRAYKPDGEAVRVLVGGGSR
jgi:hypothetical protein